MNHDLLELAWKKDFGGSPDIWTPYSTDEFDDDR